MVVSAWERRGGSSRRNGLISVFGNGLFALPVGQQSRKADLEISSGAECLPCAGQDNSPDPLILVNHPIRCFELGEEVLGDSIVLVRSVEGHDQDLSGRGR